jgi:hypothetical protein
MESIIHGLRAAVQILDVTNKTAEKTGNTVRANSVWQNLPADQYASQVAAGEIVVEAHNAPPPASREKATIYSQKAGRFTSTCPEENSQTSGRSINLQA